MMGSSPSSARKTRFATVGVCAYVLSFGAPFEWDVPLIILALSGFASALSSNGLSAPHRSPLFIWLVLFLSAVGITTLTSFDIAHSAKLSVSLLPAGLVFFLVSECFRDAWDIRLFYVSLSLLCVALSAALLWVVLGNPGALPSTWVSNLGSPILVVPNDSILLAIVAPMSFALLHRDSHVAVRIIGAVSIVLSVTAISLLQSRGAIITLLASTICAACLLRPRRGLLWGLFLLFLIAIVDGLLGFRLVAKFANISETRISLWIAAWGMFLDSPLWGHGPHTFGLLYRSFLQELALPSWLPIGARLSPWPHNLFLEVLAEQGLIGLAALGALLLSAARLGWWTWQRGQGEVRVYAIGALSGLTGFCLAGIIELTFLRLWVVVVLFAILGALSRLSRIQEENGGSGRC